MVNEKYVSDFLEQFTDLCKVVKCLNSELMSSFQCGKRTYVTVEEDDGFYKASVRSNGYEVTFLYFDDNKSVCGIRFRSKNGIKTTLPIPKVDLNKMKQTMSRFIETRDLITSDNKEEIAKFELRKHWKWDRFCEKDVEDGYKTQMDYIHTTQTEIYYDYKEKSFCIRIETEDLDLDFKGEIWCETDKNFHITESSVDVYEK